MTKSTGTTAKKSDPKGASGVGSETKKYRTAHTGSMAVSESPSGKSTPGSLRSATLSGADRSTPTRTGRPPTTSYLRSAMYYQNRIIIPETKPRPTSGPMGKHAKGASPDNTDNTNPGAVPNGPNTRGDQAYVFNNPNFRPSQQTAGAIPTGRTQCSDRQQRTDRDAMDSHGIDIVVTDTDTKNKPHKKKSICRKILGCLQDNRMKGKPNAELILASSNPQDFRLLKKVLNISFLTIGIALLVSVVIVIIYTAIVS